MIRHLTVREDFRRLPTKRQQLVAQTFIDYVEQRMSKRRKAKHHGKIVAYVWRALKAGKPYVMEKEVLAFVGRYEKARMTKRRKIVSAGRTLQSRLSGRMYCSNSYGGASPWQNFEMIPKSLITNETDGD